MAKKDYFVNKLQKEKNLPVLDNGGLKSDEPLSTKDETEEKEKERKRKVITKAQMEAAVREGNNASYLQVVYEKKRKKKIVRFNVDPEKGLDEEIVQYQIKHGLVNTKPAGSSKSITQIIVGNTFTFFNILIFGIAAWLIISAAINQYPAEEIIKQLFFVVIAIINTVVSTVQEIRSKKMMDKLSNINAPTANVIRGGEMYSVSVDNVVLDDIILLESGKQIPSDAILVAGSVEVNESLLTGESDAIEKKKGDVLHSGSFVVSGACKARVERVGKDNYVQKLTSQAQKYRKPKSDLMKTLKRIIIFMTIIIIPLGSGVFVRMYNGLPLGGTQDYMYAVTHTAGAVIGMIPSGLFLCTSIALAVGVIRLAQHNTLVQDLYCIEMLARVDVLCLDKTGTITDGSMSVNKTIDYKNSGMLNLKTAISAMQRALGDKTSTSKALEEYFGNNKRLKVNSTIAFSSQRKFSAVCFEKYNTYMLGAPEFVLKDKFYLVEKDVQNAAREGFRVLVLAYTPDPIEGDQIDRTNLEPVALILIEDNIRTDAIETIAYFKDLGVDVKVISGDNPLTVAKISQRAGIANAEQCVSLDGMNDKEVIRAASKYTVFGRVSPNQKKLIIMTLKAMGKTVAMTGDGVNDILALREADCSISVASGSEAARNVSHLVLLDSNFSSMPKVVSEGRRVINNIQKVASLFLTKTIFSLFVALYALIVRDYPIQTNQLFIIEFFVIAIPSFVLALEPNNSLVQGKFLSNVLKNALPGAIVIAITTMSIFALQGTLNLSDAETRTIIVLSATFTCYVVLYKVSTPFNAVRLILLFLMALLGFLVLIFLPNLLNIYQILPVNLGYLGSSYPRMSQIGTLLTLVLWLASYYGIMLVARLPKWIANFIRYIFKVVGPKNA